MIIKIWNYCPNLWSKTCATCSKECSIGLARGTGKQIYKLNKINKKKRYLNYVINVVNIFTSFIFFFWVGRGESQIPQNLVPYKTWRLANFSTHLNLRWRQYTKSIDLFLKKLSFDSKLLLILINKK